MAIIDDLLMQHRANAEVILFKHTAAFKQLNKENAEEFFDGLAKILKSFKSELVASSTEVFHKAIVNHIGVNTGLTQDVLAINAECEINFSKSINE